MGFSVLAEISLLKGKRVASLLFQILSAYGHFKCVYFSLNICTVYFSVYFTCNKVWGTRISCAVCAAHVESLKRRNGFNHIFWHKYYQYTDWNLVNLWTVVHHLWKKVINKLPQLGWETVIFRFCFSLNVSEYACSTFSRDTHAHNLTQECLLKIKKNPDVSTIQILKSWSSIETSGS